MNRALKLLIILIFILTGGCSTLSNQPLDNIADLLEVSYPAGSEVSQSQVLSVLISNQTNYCFSFPPDYGAKLYVNVNNNWMQIPNKIKVIGDSPVLLQPKGDIFSEGYINVFPDVTNIKSVNSMELYVLISGHVCNDSQFLIEKKIPFTVVR